MKKVTITISGEPKTGKSRLAYIIKEALKVWDFDVEFNPSPDYLNEVQFNRSMHNDMEEAIESINKKIKVIVIEKSR